MTELTWKCPYCQEVITVRENEDYAITIGEHIRVCPKQPGQVIPNITDIVERDVLEGNLIAMDDVVDQLLLVKDFTLKDSTFKEDTHYLSISIELGGEEYTLNTGAERVVQVFKQVPREKLPFYATFEKVLSKAGRRVYRIKV